MEAVQNEGDQAENIKVNGARRVPTANKNEEADEKIEQGGDAQVVFDGGRIFLRRGDQRSFVGTAVATQLIANFHPGGDTEEDAGDVRGAMDGITTDGVNDVALLNAS